MVEIDNIVLSQFSDGKKHLVTKITPRVQRLNDDGYVEISRRFTWTEEGTVSNDQEISVKITLKGKDALYEWFEARSKSMQEKSEKRKERTFTAILAIVMFILGVLADHASELLNTISR